MVWEKLLKVEFQVVVHDYHVMFQIGDLAMPL